MSKGTKLHFIVATNPLPKARPRLGRGGHTFTPAKTVAYEGIVAWECKIAMLAQGIDIFTGEIGILITFHRSDKLRADIDNLAKAILDACNGVAWNDDSQIVGICSRLQRGVPIGQAIVSVMPITDFDRVTNVQSV